MLVTNFDKSCTLGLKHRFPTGYFMGGYREPYSFFFFKPGSPFGLEDMELFGSGTVPDHNILDMDHRVVPGMGQADEIGKGGGRTLGYHLYGAVG
jgi:hypothetical protein